MPTLENCSITQSGSGKLAITVTARLWNFPVTLTLELPGLTAQAAASGLPEWNPPQRAGGTRSSSQSRSNTGGTTGRGRCTRY